MRDMADQGLLHDVVKYSVLAALCRHHAIDLFSLVTAFKPLLNQRFVECCDTW